MTLFPPLRTALLLITLAALAACASDDNDNSAPAPAAITVNNVESFSQSVANSVQTVNPQSSGNAANFSSQLLAIAPALTSLNGINITSSSGTVDISNSLQTQFSTLFTNCNTDGTAGHVSGTLTYNYVSPTNYSFSGSIQFNQLCLQLTATNQNANLDGLITFSGDQNGFKFSMVNLKIESNGQVVTANCSINQSGSTVTSDCDALNNSTLTGISNTDSASVSGITVIDNQDGTFSLSINGRIDTPNGFLNISTETPLHICSGGGFQAGKLLLTGSDNTQATLDFTDTNCSSAEWCMSDGNGGQTCNTIVYNSTPLG